MFIALQVSISLISALRPIVRAIRVRDRSLADQLQRAATSISLNLAEGAERIGGDQQQLYRVAAGSCAEVRAALAVAIAWGYLEGIVAKSASDLIDRQAARLYRLAHKRFAKPPQ